MFYYFINNTKDTVTGTERLVGFMEKQNLEATSEMTTTYFYKKAFVQIHWN